MLGLYSAGFIFEPVCTQWPFSCPIDRYNFGEPRMVSTFAAAMWEENYLPAYTGNFIGLI